MSQSDASEPEKAGTQNRVGLCFSGGGFRAALFHLGAARRLNELGLLASAKTISSVSGGSIFAAFLADWLVKKGNRRRLDLSGAEWESEIAVPVREFTSHDIRTKAVLTHLLWNWFAPGFRARHMERNYAERLTDIRVGDLPSEPEFVFCATDMAFGVNWEVCLRHTGSYQAGYLANGHEWPVARAVAASACFPPIFGPLPVNARARDFSGGKYKRKDGDRLRERIGLSDGGVYDNMGLEPVWKDHEWVLASDCGAPFQFDASHAPLSRLLRYTTVITNQARALRKRKLIEDSKRGVRGCVYWSITTAPEKPGEVGYSEELVGECISRVRTDLDAHSDAEQCVLENHGYQAAELRLHEYAKELLGPNPPPANPPHPEWMDEARVREALKESGKMRLLGRRG